jgi:hypothetical protein
MSSQALAAKGRALPSTRTALWAEVAVFVWLAWIYDAITNLAPLRERIAIAHGLDVLSLERTLHLDPELALNRWLSEHHGLGLALSDYYDNGHFIVTLGLLGWLWYRRADIYRPLRSALVSINVLGLVVFWLYPVAPPRLLPGSGFSDTVARTNALGGWHTGSLASAANQFAAMPSLHIAWAAWSALAIWRLSALWRARPRAWARGFALGHVLITAFAVIATGNHYVLDLLAGLLTVAVAVALVEVLAPHVTNLLRSLGWGRMRGERC